jgi:hypothetical protein
LIQRSTSPSVDLTAQAAEPSKEQQRFQAKQAQIETYKAQLAEQRALAQDFERRYVAAISPIERKKTHLSLSIILYLDRRLDAKGLSKTIRAEMAEIIVMITQSLMYGNVQTEHVPTIEALQAKHSVASQGGGDAFSEKIDAIFEEVLRSDWNEQLKDQQQEFAREAAKKAHLASRAKKSKVKDKDTVDEIDAQQSLREVYRRLVSLLHPDREPDAAERLRKTALMVEANAANAKQDLLALLQIQWRVLAQNADAISQIADAKLRQFNLMLDKQLTTLERELSTEEFKFRRNFGIGQAQSLQAKTLSRVLRDHVNHGKDDLEQMADSLDLIQDDVGLKYWVRAQGL